MKKNKMNILLVFIFCFAVFSSLQAAPEYMGLVVYKRGNCLLVRDKKTVPIYVDNLIPSDATIEVQKGGNLSVQFKTGVLIRLEENTRVSVEELLEKTVRIRLQRGELGGRVQKKAGFDVLIHTPTSTASVRGTDFIVEADSQKNETTVLVSEGSVDVSSKVNENEKVAVNAGNSLLVPESGKYILKIMEDFEKQKFEIFSEFEKVRKKNFDLIIQQKQKDRDLIEKQKSLLHQ